MASMVSRILTDLGDTIRASGLCRQVTMGGDGASSIVPRARVALVGVDYVPSDDDAFARWGRVRAEVHLRWRGSDAGAGQDTLVALAEGITTALMVDTYRGGLCCDVPLGRATEITQSQVGGGLRRPDMAIVLAVRCCFVQETQV
jgi:hypothetical protein